jgi:lysophospholipase L1-like esterase
MNGDTAETKVDNEYVINSYQKENIDAVVAICAEKNINLILAIVPTVPTRQKTGFKNYVKSLGLRYIDFAEAVGADEYGIWHGSPTLRKWVSGDNAIYTQILSTSTTVLATNGNHVFDVNGNVVSGTVSNYNQTLQTIEVNGTTYTYDSDMVGLLSKDGVHPDIKGGKVLASQVLVDCPELTLKD